MNNFYDYIEALKKHTKLSTNKKIADYLGVSRQYITKLKYGNSWLSKENALAISKALGINAAEIIMVIYAEKSSTPSERSEWLKQAELVRSEINPPEQFKK